jgi:serine/threonine protein kinase
VVYRAHDRQLLRWVALKVLREQDAAAVIRFKREFRALADLVHPNLARLLELFVEDERVFFTMELVKGRPLVDFVRAPSPASSGHATTGPVWAQLVDVFLQLAEGVAALHVEGLLHRDLKPSNVLVTEEGRVVILDFGLVADAPGSDRGPSAPGTRRQLCGTPAYMAPEQFMSPESTEASDWYSVGVMLYEALSGELPFGGDLVKMITAKTELPPPQPADAVTGTAPDLSRLCLDLLHPNPLRRPAGDAIIGVLRGTARGPSSRPARVAQPRTRSVFVGRERHLAALNAAFERVTTGELAVVCVRGGSGLGKTALVHQFLRGVAGPVCLFTGRCHEREALGYKALDGVVDGLSQFLKDLPTDECARLIPDRLDELVKLFPALTSISAVSDSLRRRGEPIERRSADLDEADTGEQRRRAFEALRELLARLSRQRRVILFIDDLQWGDHDSAALLRHVLRPPDAPALLLIAACRQDDRIAPAFGTLLDALRISERLQELIVDPLGFDETRALATRLLGVAHQAIDSVSREAAGVPLFVDALVEQIREHASPEAAEQRAPLRDQPTGPPAGAGEHDLRLQTVLLNRVDGLPDEARRLLEVVALAGKPLRRPVAEQASGIGRGDEGASEQLLRVRHLLRLGTDGASLEPYHDRIRDTVTSALPAKDLPDLHRRIAQALMDGGQPDPEDMALHLGAAGDRERAADFAIAAAEKWTAALAFDRAAASYRMAADLKGPDHGEAGALMLKTAESFSAAGRGAPAGDAYLTAADKMPSLQLELTCKGGEQLLRSGDMERGRAVMTRLLRRLGWRIPRTSLGALVAMIARRAQLALRGLRVNPEWAPRAGSRQNLIRMDASWALASSAMMVDTLRATYYQTHHLLLALKEGEPFRLGRALGLEAIQASLKGGRSPERADRILALLTQVTHNARHPVMNGLAPLAECIVAANRGQWLEARARSLRAIQILGAHGAGVAWELSTARSFLLGALGSMGEFREYAACFPAFLDDSRTRGDLYAEAILVLSSGSYILGLTKDAPEEAEHVVNTALARLSGRGFQLPKVWGLFARVDIALYAGDVEKAWQIHREAWPRVSRSLLLHVQTIRLYMRHQRARAALALASRVREGPRRRGLIRLALAQARAIDREQAPWAAGLAALTRCGTAYLDNQRAEIPGMLAESVTHLRAAHLSINVAAAQYIQGLQTPGPEGRRLVDEADAWMRSQTIKRPDRVAALVAPGFDGG